jgi:hypothetical protein
MGMNDVKKKFMVISTQRRVDIMDAILSRKHQDRHSMINELLKLWVLDNLDDDELIEPVRVIFGSMADT